jgi:hypothetical protein
VDSAIDEVGRDERGDHYCGNAGAVLVEAKPVPVVRPDRGIGGRDSAGWYHVIVEASVLVPGDDQQAGLPYG